MATNLSNMWLSFVNVYVMVFTLSLRIIGMLLHVRRAFYTNR